MKIRCPRAAVFGPGGFIVCPEAEGRGQTMKPPGPKTAAQGHLIFIVSPKHARVIHIIPTSFRILTPEERKFGYFFN